MEKTIENTKGNGDWQAAFVTEDLADFLVTHQTLICGHGSTIDDIKRVYAAAPDLRDIVDKTLVRLEEAGLISVAAGRITVHHTAMEMNSSPESLARFLPRLMRITTERVLENALTGLHKKRKEFARFFVFPGDPETVGQARALYEEYKTKMKELIDRAGKEERMAEKVRLVGIVGCELETEDFV